LDHIASNSVGSAQTLQSGVSCGSSFRPWFGRWLRACPDVDERKLRQLFADRDRDIDFAEVEEEEDRNIELVIEAAGDYRIRQVRKLVAQPFLLLLKNTT